MLPQCSSDFTLFTAEDIDSAFDRVKTLKHHQLIELDLQGVKLTLVGCPSGHMVGGTIWVLETGGEVLVYGPDTNHTRER